MTTSHYDYRLCQNCDFETMHYCIDSDHERDSSQDYHICLRCGRHYSGMTGKYTDSRLRPVSIHVPIGCIPHGYIYGADNTRDLSEDMLDVELPNGVLVYAGYYPSQHYRAQAAFGLNELIEPLMSRSPEECARHVQQLIDRFNAPEWSISFVIRRLEQIAKANDDIFRYSIEPDMNFYIFSCTETADGHDFVGGSGATINEACKVTYENIKAACEAWGYVLPDEVES